MRRLLLSLTVGAAVMLGGCGSSTVPSGTGTRDAELSYFPSGSPFVMSVVTDPNATAVKQGQALIARFPLATFGESALISKLQQQGIDYHNDIRPLFGNPLMVGASGPTLGGGTRNEYLVVWVVKDAGKFRALVKRLPGLHSVGSHDGATLYQTGGATTLAINGSTVLLAPSAASVNNALDRHAHGGGINPAEFSRTVSGLPHDALIQMYGTLSGVLSTPRAAKARNVPWVAALRGYAASLTASSAGVAFQYRLDTGGRPLSAAQLPIAGGSTAPNFAGTLPITLGIKNPAQAVMFAEGAEQAASPSGYASFLKRQATVRAKTGVDLNSLLALLTGDLIVASDSHTTMGRAAVSDPAAAARTVSKLVSQPRSVFSKTTSVSALGGGMYALKEPKQTIILGVTGGQLVVGRASAAALRAFAAAPTTPATGAQGSIAFRIALPALLHLGLKQTQSKIAQTIVSSLGDITGWLASSPSALTGSASLALK